VSANGKYLYVTNEYSGTVVTLEINESTGGLRYIGSVDDGGMGDNRPQDLATTKNGAFVFNHG